MKKFLKNLLVVTMVIAIVLSYNISAFATNSHGVDRFIYNSTDLGGATSATDATNCAINKVDGKNMLYITLATRPFAKFVAYNIDDNVIEFIDYAKTSDEYGAKNSWSHKFDSEGNLIMVPHGYITVYKYNPRTKEFTNSGAPLPGLTAAYGLCLDEEDNIYFGGYPLTNIYKYDKNLKLLKQFDDVFPGEKYVMSMTYYKGKLYAGGQAQGTKFIQIDAKTGSIKDLKQPVATVGLPFEPSSYYMMDRIDNLIFCMIKPVTGAYQLFVYDAEKQDWVFNLYRAYGHYMPPTKDGKSYVIAEIPGNANKETGWLELDLKTFETKYTGVPFYGNFVGGNWVELPEYSDMPGESLVTFSKAEGSLIAFNFESKKMKILREKKLPSEPLHIQDIETGLDNTLLLGAYMGEKTKIYNPSTGESELYKSTQTEKIKRYGDKAYLGCYTQAVLYEMDLTAPPSDSNPKQLFNLSKYFQDRIYDICKLDNDLIAVATYPRVGFDTGVLAIYDLNSGSLDVYENISPGQSIEGLAYKDGVIYGSTSKYVNVTPTPTDEAIVFAFDVATRKVIKQTPVKINKFNGKNKVIADLEVGPDGNIWGVTTGAIFCLDPKTLETKKSVIADKMVEDRKTMSTIAHLMWDKDGYLYAACNGFLIILDPETMKFNHTKKSMQYFVIGEDNNIYHSNFSNQGHLLSKFTVSELNKGEHSAITAKTGDGVVMMLDQNIAAVQGEAKYIDANDKNIKPFTREGNTLVPVRFISESFGATVDWNDAEQMVTITKGATVIKIVIGSKTFTVNGEEKALNYPAITEYSRTMLPLRAIAESLGQDVFWDDRGLITITPTAGAVTADDKKLVDNLILYITSDMTRLLSGNHIIKPAQ